MIDFSLSDEQAMLTNAVREFVRKEVPPDRARELDESHKFPWDTWKKMGDLGWLGLPIEPDYGGSGASILDVVLFAEALSYGLPAFSAAFQRSVCYGGLTIGSLGTHEQKAKYLPPIAAGDQMVSISLTEPGAGSDAAGLTTQAVRRDGAWYITGQKVYTTGASEADHLVVAVRTDPDAPPREGITTFVIPKDREGITVRPLDKLGNWMITTCEVFYDAVRAEDDEILGGLNQAWQTTLSHGLDAERLFIGAHCTGAAQRLLELATEYAGDRVQFGKPIGSYQLIRQKLADLDVAIQSARLLTYYGAWCVDRSLPARKASSAAKLAASETWNKAAYECMQIFGGVGYMMESEVQRHYRDARLYTIGGGTSEIQRLIISHELAQ